MMKRMGEDSKLNVGVDIALWTWKRSRYGPPSILISQIHLEIL